MESVRVSHVQKAYNQLQELIVLGRLAPGTRIIESELAKRLGVSRTPVRDALRLLQQQGFVVESATGSLKSRLLVAPLTREDARELYGIVGRIEGMAARHTAQLESQRRAELVRELKSSNADLRGLTEAERRDPNRFFELDRLFHRTVVEPSAGPRLLLIHDSIMPQTERYWRLYANAAEHIGNSAAEHDQIIDAIEEGDAEKAEKAIESNWQNGWERLCQLIDTLGERGSW